MCRQSKGMVIIWLCVALIAMSPVCLGSNPFGWSNTSLAVKLQYNVVLCSEDKDNCPILFGDPLHEKAFRIRHGDFRELFEMWTLKGTTKRTFIKSKKDERIGPIYDIDGYGTHWDFKFYPLFEESRYIYVQNRRIPSQGAYDFWSITKPNDPSVWDKYPSSNEEYQFLYKHWLIIHPNGALDTRAFYEKGLVRCPNTAGSCLLQHSDIPLMPIDVIRSGGINQESLKRIKEKCFDGGFYCTMNMDSGGREILEEPDLQVVMHSNETTVIFFGRGMHAPPYYLLRCKGHFFYFPTNIVTAANNDPEFLRQVEPNRDVVFPIFKDGDPFWEYCAVVDALVDMRFEDDNKFNPYDSEVLAEQYFYDNPEYIVPDIFIKKEAKKKTLGNSTPRACVHVTLLLGMLVIAAALMLV